MARHSSDFHELTEAARTTIAGRRAAPSARKELGLGRREGAVTGRREGSVSGRRLAVRRVLAQTPSTRRAATQAQLLEAGRALIIEKGVGATSVGDICSAAGFSRGAFYSNFTDMEHFVARLASEQWSQIVDFVHSAMDSVLDEVSAKRESAGGSERQLTDAELTEAVSQLADGILQAMPVTRDFYMLQSEFAGVLTRKPRGASSLAQGYGDFKVTLRDLLVGGLAAIGRRTMLDPNDATELVIAAAERSMRMALMDDDESALTDLLERTLPVLLTRLSIPVE